MLGHFPGTRSMLAYSKGGAGLKLVGKYKKKQLKY